MIITCMIWLAWTFTSTSIATLASTCTRIPGFYAWYWCTGCFAILKSIICSLCAFWTCSGITNIFSYWCSTICLTIWKTIICSWCVFWTCSWITTIFSYWCSTSCLAIWKTTIISRWVFWACSGIATIFSYWCSTSCLTIWKITICSWWVFWAGSGIATIFSYWCSTGCLAIWKTIICSRWIFWTCSRITSIVSCRIRCTISQIITTSLNISRTTPSSISLFNSSGTICTMCGTIRSIWIGFITSMLTQSSPTQNTFNRFVIFFIIQGPWQTRIRIAIRCSDHSTCLFDSWKFMLIPKWCYIRWIPTTNHNINPI